MNTFTTVNPFDNSPIERYTYDDWAQVKLKVTLSNDAQKKWAKTDLKNRSNQLMELAKVLDKGKAHYAQSMAIEMGKPIPQGLSEIEKCIKNCHYYAEHLENYLAPEKIKADDINAYRYYEPLGLIYAIMPWNFPFWQVLRFAIPNIAAGNGIILKHAKNVVGTSLMIEEAFKHAGFPEHLLTNVIIEHDLSEKIINHPAIQGVTLTGSDDAGKVVGKQAGKAIKKVVLELGGSDPYLILDDADLKHAAKQCIEARLLNCGQICVSPKRIIVTSKNYDVFVSEIKDLMTHYQSSNPLDQNCKLGPMARASLRQTLHQQVEKSIQLGAKCLVGGIMPEGIGNNYPPTLLTNITSGMPAYDEELFGPVVTIISAASEEDAIRIANDSKYGLGAAIFSKDVERATHIATKRIQTGMCSINRYVASDPRVPFGGVKQSGFGREVSREGIHEFVNVKSIMIG